MKNLKIFYIFMMVFTLAFSTNAFAIDDNSSIVQKNAKSIKSIENYINNIKYMSSSFVQTSSGGEIVEGNFYLNRPKKLRIEYKPPTNVLIVANGGVLMYYDKELDEVIQIRTKSTPLYILTKENFSLNDKEIQVTGFEEDDEMIRVSATKKGGEGIGQISFVFNKSPMTLIKIETIDEFENLTEVFLYNVDLKTKLSKELFKIKNPRMLQ